MKEVIEILMAPACGSLATVENGKPRVRPFAFMFEEEGKFYFCTANNKEVYKQLVACPSIEYTKTTNDMHWLRMSGDIKFDEDLKHKEKCFQATPMLKDIYQSPENPIFKVFYLEHGVATIDSFSEARKVFKF